MARGAPGEEVYTPEVSAFDLPRKVVPYREAAPIGQAVEQAAEASNRKYQADSATWAGDQLAQARIKAANDLEAAKANAPTGDQTGFTQKYLASFDKDNASLAQSAGGNPLARQMIIKGLTDLRQTLQAHTQQWEGAQNVAYRETSVRNNTQSQLALVEAHPEMGPQVGSTLTDQIDRLGGDPSRRDALKREIYPQLALAEANGLTRQDPRGALQALNDPDKASSLFKPVLTGLTDAQREAVRAKANEHLGDVVYGALGKQDIRGAQLALNKNEDLLDPKTAEALQRTINGQVSSTLALQDKQQKDASDSLLKNAILMQQQGKLTDQWIEKNHNVWEPAAYEYAKKLLSGKETQTDTPTYLNLLNRQSHGEDVRPDTMSAAAQGLLNKQDAGKLLESSGKEQPEFYKRGHDYIQTAGQVSQLEPDPAKTQTLANMQNDWVNDVRAHPEWANDPVKAEADFRGIVSRYQLVKADQNLLTLPVPKYLSGTRIAPDIAATKQATFKAFQNKEIDQDEFNRQALLLSQWQHAQEIALQRKAAAKAANP